MKNAEAVLLVKFNSSLSPEDLMKRCQENLDDFRNVPGLLQKYYLSEESTGAISGFYVFENKEARAAFWNSRLAKNIPARYGGLPDSFRVEQYEMAIVLNEPLLA
ncbi:MAG TPA: YdhR family protein [Hanamia sp.]|nr:YdhR family protein [Hanamia sp.]